MIVRIWVQPCDWLNDFGPITGNDAAWLWQFASGLSTTGQGIREWYPPPPFIPGEPQCPSWSLASSPPPPYNNVDNVFIYIYILMYYQLGLIVSLEV